MINLMGANNYIYEAFAMRVPFARNIFQKWLKSSGNFCGANG